MRRLLALVSAIIFVDAMLFTALTPLVPGYVEEFDLSKTGAGLLVGAFGAGALLGGVPGGIAAARFGAKRAVIFGLVLLGIASFVFAVADGAVALGLARFVQGFSSTVTWAGALAWIAGGAPREQRGQVIGTAFGAAVFGAILGPMFGGLAETVGIRVSFVTVGIVALVFAGLAGMGRAAPMETMTGSGIRRALRDTRFLGGLWLNTLPALLFGILIVLGPLALDDRGWSTLGIAAVFFAAGLFEVVINPLLGRATDRVGRLLPIRAALTASIVVAVGLAAASAPLL
ncbi:MAG: MFS transporter, partial [Gaiellaceae bacterium]